jgi:hypothetical protein
MNDTPQFSARDSSNDQDELEDRRRPGRPKVVNPNLICLLRDPAGGHAGSADGLHEAARAYYLAREERFRAALGKGAHRALRQETVGRSRVFNVWELCIVGLGGIYTATIFTIASRFVPKFRERRPEEAYYDDKYIGHY